MVEQQKDDDVMRLTIQDLENFSVIVDTKFKESQTVQNNIA